METFSKLTRCIAHRAQYLWMLLGCIVFALGPAHVAARASIVRQPVTIKTLVESGGRVDWSATTNLIAYDRMGSDGWYRVYTMQSDGSNQRCLTCNTPAPLPKRHQGNPAWYPTGKYLVIQAEKATHNGLPMSATPGLGFYSDLWLITSDGLEAWPLTNVSPKNQGVLHPHFSPDGKRLSWSELQTDTQLHGTLKVADFSIDANGPHLTNIRTYAPDGMVFNENHGFTADGKSLLFSGGNAFSSGMTRNDIYQLDLTTGAATPLTNQGYNEHATAAPDGKYITWMSSSGNGPRGTDLWRMQPGGTDKVRLTNFNQPGNTEFSAVPQYVADNSWSPDESHIVVYVQNNLATQTGKIVLITLQPAQTNL